MVGKSRLHGMLAVVATLSLTACVSTPNGAVEGPAALESDEMPLFVCVPEAGAPHKRIDILEVTMTPEEVAAAKAAEQDAEAEPPTDPDTTTMEKNVRLALNDVDQGVEGHCFRKNDGGRYVCQSFDGGLKLEWPGEAPKDQEPAGPSAVKVKEKWLFGTKDYGASCTRKA